MIFSIDRLLSMDLSSDGFAVKFEGVAKLGPGDSPCVILTSSQRERV
jgi:hypothetical protein